MIRQNTLDCLSENKRTQKLIISQAQIAYKLDLNDYQILICWILQHMCNMQYVLDFIFFSGFLSQYCDNLGLQKSTKYLAKCYLDSYIHNCTHLNQQWLEAICVCCVWIAVKFNEPHQYSEKYSIKIVLIHSNNKTTADELLQLEIEILKSMSFRLKLTTPFDYIEPFFNLFPYMQKIKSILSNFIDLALSKRQILSCSAEELFYACFKATVNNELTSLQHNILYSQNVCWNNVEKISLFIRKDYQQLIKEGSIQ